MDYITTVRVLLSESREPVAGVKVALYDRDDKSDDDLLGTGTTNKIGEVDFHYRTRDFTDGALGLRDDGKDSTPDLYAVVYNAAGDAVLSTRDHATQNKASGHILVLLDETIAQVHKLSSEA
jgi:hypothetical protein